MRGESTQQRGALPAGWCETTLGTCLDVLRGVSYAKEQSRSSPSDGFVPILRANNIGESLNFDDLVYVLENCISDQQMLQVGDIVVAASSGSMKVVGKAAPLLAPWRGAFGAFCYALRVHPALSAQYVAAFLNTEEYRHQASERAKGTNINNLRREHITSVRFRLPPRAEQTRIADRIDELFTDLAAGVAALERVKRNLSRYRAAVLHAAVTGRLTEAWRKQHGPPKEPGPKLLERILAERRRQWEQRTLAKYAEKGRTPPKNWKSRYQEPTPPTTDDLPALPKGWCWATLNHVSDVAGGVAKNQKDAGKPGRRLVPYLRVANVQQGFLDLREMKQISAAEKDIEELRLQHGDVLFTEGGDRNKLGRGWIWEEQIPECIHQNHIFRARLFDGHMRPELLSHAGNSYGRQWFLRNGKQSVNLASISLGVLRQFPIPLPPQAEQSAIVEAVQEKLSQIDALESEVEHGLKRASRMRQAILKAAFEGRLVAQDAADEPASILLERIRAEAAAPAQRGKRASATVKKVRPPRRSKATEPRGIYFKRAAVAAYAVRTLGSSKYFGRTQLEKVLYLSQTHLRIDLSLQFMRKAAGPYDKAIHKIESLAGKRDWFQTKKRPNGGVRYEAGAAIANRCEWVERNLADERAGLDSLLSLFKKMKTEQAELFATVYAAWNDLLAEGKSAGSDAIVAEVRGWHESKQRFEPQRIKKCIDWMQQHGYVPRGEFRSTMLEGASE